MYFDQVTRQKKGKTIQQAAQYQKFPQGMGRHGTQHGYVQMDIELHPMYDLKKNLEVFDASKGKSQAQSGWKIFPSSSRTTSASLLRERGRFCKRRLSPTNFSRSQPAM